MTPIIVDIHAHFFPRLLVECFETQAAQIPHVKISGTDERVLVQIGDESRAVMPAMSDLTNRRLWMDRNGIDHQLVAGWVEIFGYELPAREGLAWSRLMNACMREALAGEPRFTPLATVPLQDGKLAAEVLVEAMEQGFGGVMIGTLPEGASGNNLDHASLDPFWESAARLGAAVFLHPMTFCGEPRLGGYGLMNALGRVEDTAIAVSRLLFSGHLLRYAGLKLVLSHGGGTLPYALGRLARSHANAPGKVADPQQGFSTLYFDSCVFDSDALEFLARRSSAERIMLGSDAPFPMGDPEPKAVVERARLTAAQKRAILGTTAQQVFRVRLDRMDQSSGKA